MSTEVPLADTAPSSAATGRRGGNGLDLAPASARRKVVNVLMTAVMWGAFLLALVPLVWILWTVVSKGWHDFTSDTWFTNSQRNMSYKRPGGGARHAINGTLLQGAVTALIAVPIAILTAIYLVEYGRGWFARAVSFMVDILTGIPSIVAALFIYAVWVTTFGDLGLPEPFGQRAVIAVCLALVLLMVPTVVRSTEEMLKLVPNELREASYALGVPKWKTIARIVLPTAFSGIVTGVLLGLSRVMGETAPLLVLGPYSKNLRMDLFDTQMGTLPTMINESRAYMQGNPASADRAWAAALTLILLVLALNLLGRLIARFGRIKA